jgi:hypothetical protein
VPGTVARTLLIGALLLAVAGCGYDVSATFNADGTVALGLKFLLPNSLLAGGQGLTVSGFSDADIAKANTELASKYPGAKVVKVTEGDEAGVLLTIPFKTEKDAFAFMTEPTKLNPSGATSGGGSTIDVGNTGGLFVSATHTTSGQTDTYTFKTQAQPPASPSPGAQANPADDLSSIIRITFSLTVPHEITSAPDALFTQDRKTAVWELSLIQAQTLTATTSSSVTLAGFASNAASGQSSALLIGVGLVAIALGFALAKITPWLFVRGPAVVPATAPAPAPGDVPWPAGGPPGAEPPSNVFQGPPPEMPPPPNPA